MNRDEIKAIYDQGPEAVIDLVERLFKIIEQQQKQISAQQVQIENLTLRVKELENQLAANSRNSSKPPSSDGFGKKTKSLRQKSGKKSGGQPGHQGNTLKQVDKPDQVIIHEPIECNNCGKS